MKRPAKVITIAVLVLLALLVCTLLWQHFITDQIMDKGMEYGEYQYGMVDGDHTYMDNPKLFEVLEGCWESNDGRWALTITGEAFDTQMSLSLNGEAAVECNLDYTYLLPDSDPNRKTDLEPEMKQLTDGSGNSLGEIVSLYHRADEGDGTLHLTVRMMDESEEAITLYKTS